MQSRAFTLSTCKLKSKDGFSGYYNGLGEEDEEDGEDFIEDSEVDELFQQQVPTIIGDGEHRIVIVHPDVKWGNRKQYLTTGDQRKMQS